MLGEPQQAVNARLDGDVLPLPCDEFDSALIGTVAKERVRVSAPVDGHAIQCGNDLNICDMNARRCR